MPWDQKGFIWVLLGRDFKKLLSHFNSLRFIKSQIFSQNNKKLWNWDQKYLIWAFLSRDLKNLSCHT